MRSPTTLTFPRLLWLALSLQILSGSLCAADPPLVTLLPARNISHEGASFRARVNPRGALTAVAFYVDGINVARNGIPVGDADREIDVSKAVLGLKPDTVYAIVVKAKNAFGQVESAPLQFTTASRPADAPVITTLPPRVESGKLIKRATVDPGGRTVTISFYNINGNATGYFGPYSGDSPVTIEEEIPAGSDDFYYARGYYHDAPPPPRNQQGTKGSGGIYASGSSPIGAVSENKESSALTPPGLNLIRVEDITPNSGSIYSNINTSSRRTYVDVFVDGVRSGTYHFSPSSETQNPYFPIEDLAPATTYAVTAIASNAAGSTTSGPMTFTTTGSSPVENHPPVIQPPPVFRVGIEGTAKGVISAFDPDNDSLSLTYTQGNSGAVSADGWEFTYTPGSDFFGTDTFQVTVTDTHGASASAVCLVSLGVSTPSGGNYDLVVNLATDPPKPAGRLTLNVNPAKAFSGSLSIYGAQYSLKGSFDEGSLAVIELDRVGLPPLFVTLNLLPGEGGLPRISATIGAPELNVAYVASGEPVGDTVTNAGLVNQSYTVMLPMRSSDAATPQGDGFLTGNIGRSGRARFVGRTGDGQSFSVGRRLQRNGELGIGITVGKNPRDYLGGQLTFTRDDVISVGGALDWISYRNPTEHYRTNFTRSMQPFGARYRAPKKGTTVFGDPGAESSARFLLLDQEGAPLIDAELPLKNQTGLKLDENTRGSLKVNKRTGFFRGVIPGTTGDKRTFSGVIIQPVKRGGGMLNLNGPVGAVELTPPK